jgi:hypothetical protein
MEEYKDQEWYKHFQSKFRAKQQTLAAMKEVIRLYGKLWRKDLEREEGISTTTTSGSSSPRTSEDTSRLEASLQQKSKQIESQQALLNDLQAQLSSKESEIRDLNKRLQTNIAQGAQLRAQLEATHTLLQEKELEIVRLRTEIRALEEVGKMEIIESLNPSPQIADDRDFSLKVPSRLIHSHQLPSTNVTPGFITATRATSGPQIIAVGTDKLFSFISQTMSEASELRNNGVPLLCGSISPENDLILIGSSESQLSLVDFNGRLLKDLKGHGGKVKSCGFLGSKGKAFSVATDRTIKLWDLTRACPIRSVPVTSQLIGAAATLDGTMIVTCHLNGKISVWSPHDKICEVEAHTDTCLGVSLSPDGRYITSVAKDNTVAVIDLHMAQTGPIHKLKGFSVLSTDTVPACSLDSRIVSVAGAKGIYSWDLLIGNPLGVIATEALGVAWVSGNSHSSEASSHLVSIHGTGCVKWWAA